LQPIRIVRPTPRFRPAALIGLVAQPRQRVPEGNRRDLHC
jgi:hypothetical protein